MDENVKNDAKQVMLVQNADDGRLQAVTGVDRDGNIQTADPTDQNVASQLNVNTQPSKPSSKSSWNRPRTPSTRVSSS